MLLFERNNDKRKLPENVPLSKKQYSNDSICNNDEENEDVDKIIDLIDGDHIEDKNNDLIYRDI